MMTRENREPRYGSWGPMNVSSFASVYGKDSVKRRSVELASGSDASSGTFGGMCHENHLCSVTRHGASREDVVPSSDVLLDGCGGARPNAGRLDRSTVRQAPRTTASRRR